MQGVTAQGVDQPHDALGYDRGRHRGGAEAELELAEAPGPQRVPDPESPESPESPLAAGVAGPGEQALDKAQRADERDRHAAQGQDQ